MSKIINKKQLDFLIESTMKGYSNPYNDGPLMPGMPSLSDYCLSPEGKHDPMCKEHREANLGDSEETKSESYMKDEMCECGGMMYEGKCNECGMSYMEEGDWMKEDELEEGDAFGKAVSDAKEAGKTEFEFQGKTYPVKESDNVEESVKDLAESVTKTFNPSFLTEDMDNFKKLINYRNK